MGRRQLLALVFVSGYIVAFLPVLWARRDISRIPRSIWRYAAPRPRQLWRGGVVVAYLCGGWPGLVVAVVWRFSSDRTALREEWAHLHRRNVASRTVDTDEVGTPAHAEPATPVDREIVLADYEDQPELPSREDAPP